MLVAELVASYRDPRVRYRHNGRNLGLTGNAVAASREARGEYVCTLHDDDMWEPTLLEELVPPLEADRDLVLAFSDHWVMRSDDSVDLELTEAATRRWGRRGLREGRGPVVSLGLGRPFQRPFDVQRMFSVPAWDARHDHCIGQSALLYGFDGACE